MGAKAKKKTLYKNKQNLMRTICITTGSLKGIGSEVTYKALKKLKLKKNFKFIVFRSNKTSFVSFRKKDNVEKSIFN